MDAMSDISLRDLVLTRETSVDFYHETRQGVTSRREAIDELEVILDEITDPFRRGVVLDLLGRREEARETLFGCKDNILCMHLLGKLLLEEGSSKKALNVLETGWKSCGAGEPRVGMLLCEALILEDKIDEARVLLGSLQVQDDQPRISYLNGLLHQHEGDYQEALESYSTAAEGNPDETRFLFRLGYMHSLYGDEEKAIEAYRMCQRSTPLYAHAMINLGVLYEDAERFGEAITCYRMVLLSNPDHARARLYLRDASASQSMYYDRDKDKDNVRKQQVLQIPVTEFELSVRSRNCLQKMGIHTLGDLVSKSEPELLSYKNFGETSLQEIRKILNQKKLRLGEGTRSDDNFMLSIDGEAASLLGEPVSLLELSSRSQRCMDRLGIETIADLMQRNELELVSQKNFGVTSLNEVKRKLSDRGLNLTNG
ncbi:MAG: tetratricopeptide repeat protein [Planctomycetes bacterium]|nr:tetratricopeptide repeat protein [Planctomycetota bacterium]MBT6541037.1 tetratricopeptide repeat protein [Planctomycetota bacterium]MBT6785578.1 tetratricopeptide repeat protein [Planctomycetota bacterium]MBT6967474.1 tetratricopeptide repeat protein [Planctomycetota bacterium]MBT7641273.1 tetratricopeptide repeat protein [Planctomycetota bacterium]